MKDLDLLYANEKLVDALKNLRDCVSAYMSTLSNENYDRFAAFDRRHLHLNVNITDTHIDAYINYLDDQNNTIRANAANEAENQEMKRIEQHLSSLSAERCDRTGTGYCLERGLDCDTCGLNDNRGE